MENPEKYVMGSKTLLNVLLEQDRDAVPDEVQRVQELVECMNNNAKKIAAALAANRKRSAGGADVTAQLLKEQMQYSAQIVELYGQLSNKSAPGAQTTTQS